MAAALSLDIAAQSRVGHFSIIPKIGASIANIIGESIATTEGGVLKPKYKAGFVGGVEGSYQVSDRFGVSLGVLYATLGNRYTDYSNLLSVAEDGKTSSYAGVHANRINLGYVQMPLIVAFQITEGLAVKTGMQVGMLTGARQLYDETAYTMNTETGERAYGKPSNYDVDRRKNMNSTDFSIPIGLSYEYLNVVLDARYNFGLSKVSMQESGTRNSFFTFTVGYRFEL